ncbi:DUF885 domain-containing protein [Amycolatopsis sp. NPDC059657]|uniref:DUF885 domain-containing protein n=1 Tax=Amycolatopsis sp. NPDC059657 TaxID=3346899 RepID=UPI003670A198
MIDALADELIEIRFAADPIWPSLLGLPADHGKLPDPTAEGERRTRLALAGVVARAEAVDRSGLSTVDAVTRDVIIQQAKSMLDVLDSRLPDYTVSDAFSAPVQRLLLLMPSLILSDDEKSRGFLARLVAIPSYVDGVIERQRAALEEGFAPAGFLVDMGVDFFERYLASPETDPLRVESELDGFVSERDRLLAEVVRPAFLRYKDFLALEMKPRARPDTQPGLCWKPGGAEKYAKLIQVHTTVSMTAEELHELGLSVLAGLATEYRELGERVFGVDDLAEIFERLRTDPALRWNSGEELLESARAAISRAETVAPRWFNSVPPTKCLVDAIPAAQADGGTMGYYLERALDGSREGTYFANTFDAHERPRHVSEAIAFHEAVPGHHFQIELAQELTELPLLRRMAEVNSYSEGWGLYAERLADEMGLYSGDVAKFGMLLQDSLRAGRLVVDTGMHALGWSRAQAVGFLRVNTPMTPLEIEAEIDRYAGWPAQALSYMVGRLEIQRMRTEAEKALGDRFDIKAFHDVVLGSGVLPLPVLAKLVEDWVAAQ